MERHRRIPTRCGIEVPPNRHTDAMRRRTEPEVRGEHSQMERAETDRLRYYFGNRDKMEYHVVEKT